LRQSKGGRPSVYRGESHEKVEWPVKREEVSRGTEQALTRQTTGGKEKEHLRSPDSRAFLDDGWDEKIGRQREK